VDLVGDGNLLTTTYLVLSREISGHLITILAIKETEYVTKTRN